MSDVPATVRRRKVSAAIFSRIEGGGNLVDEVATQIRGHIEEGHFRKGERLPSERDLADELGISRTVLRESLRSLESLGYVEARLGQGRFVVDPDEPWHSQRLIDDWLRRHQSALRDLIEMRSAIESQALRGSSADPREVAASLRDLVETQAVAIAEGRADDAADIDAEFHIKLASGTPNQPLRSLATAIIMRARQAAHAAYRVSAYKQASLRQHRAILAALRAGDRDRAADLLAEHHLSRSDQLASYLEHARPDAEPAHLTPADPVGAGIREVAIRGTSSRRAPD
jgi:GntR family transcriptional repressor for pyruvate dehydrogenase complex